MLGWQVTGTVLIVTIQFYFCWHFSLPFVYNQMLFNRFQFKILEIMCVGKMMERGRQTHVSASVQSPNHSFLWMTLYGPKNSSSAALISTHCMRSSCWTSPVRGLPLQLVCSLRQWAAPACGPNHGGLLLSLTSTSGMRMKCVIWVLQAGINQVISFLTDTSVTNLTSLSPLTPGVITDQHTPVMKENCWPIIFITAYLGGCTMKIL